MLSTAAILVAAGKGERAGGGVPKQYRALAGRPVLRWSLDALMRKVDRTIVVIDPDHRPLMDAAAGDLADRIQIVPGGAARTDSVRAGIAALHCGAEPDLVLVHDAARPGLDDATIDNLIRALDTASAAAPALPIADALKRVEGARVLGEAQRDGLMRVQTPQAFRFEALVRAYDAAPAGASYEDDLAIARAAGFDATLIPGDAKLMKLTHSEDFALLERLLGAYYLSCVGSGFDAHRFGEGDHVTLCGVKIKHERGIIGHSDADVGWHALTDALLGAIGAGDIGLHFPPSDPKWKGADSEIFLRHAASLVEEAGGRIVHVDVTLICERPKIGLHRDAMRARTAEALALPLPRVSVKATTTEKMGFMGREEGLAAQATATVELPR
ncbi:MAG: bifunctional 2-C-methyl-D-erythritol 4-phosphate cytidylyltransferase/2-C-methyl-D-erythritol 2,4-cyclodiphosphate synthase [Hyphomonadaceae bacterium]